MNINNQTFPYEIVLPGLLQWFNSRPANQRVIQTNDVALFKVRIIEDSDGEYSFIVGPNPYEEPGTNYVLEATFLWCGPRGINLIAEPEHFFEVSKFLAMTAGNPDAAPLNIITFNGVVELPEITTTILQTIHYNMVQYGAAVGNNNRTTNIFLTGAGEMVIPMDSRYDGDSEPTDVFMSKNIQSLYMGELYFIALYNDGVVKYTDIMSNQINVSGDILDQIPPEGPPAVPPEGPPAVPPEELWLFEHPTTHPIVSVAAVGDTFILVNDRGDVEIIGQGFSPLKSVTGEDMYTFVPWDSEDEVFTGHYNKFGGTYVPPNLVRSVYAHTDYIKRDNNGYGDKFDAMHTIIMYIMLDGSLQVTTIVSEFNDYQEYKHALRNGTIVETINDQSHAAFRDKPILSDVKQVDGNFNIPFALTSSGTLHTWGDYDITTIGGFDPSFMVDVQSIKSGWFTFSILKKDGTVIILQRVQNNEDEPMWEVLESNLTESPVTQLDISETYIMTLHVDGTISYYGGLNSGQQDTPTDLFTSPPVQVIAGENCSGAILEDGSLIYWFRWEDGAAT